MKITNEGWAVIEWDSHIGKWVEENKRLDFDQNALPKMLPYIKPDSVVLDIGANIGCYAYAFAKVAKEVICFEPNYHAYKCFEYNFKEITNVSLFKIPLSDKMHPCALKCENENAGMAYIDDTVDLDLAFPLDNLLDPPLERCDFVKIDVEGYELKVLMGGEQTINKLKPVLVIEINDHTLKRTNTTREEIFQWLTDHGYAFRNIYAEQGLQDEQLDIICFPS